MAAKWIILASTADSPREKLYAGPFKTRKEARIRLGAIEASRRDSGYWGIDRRSPDDLVVEIYYGYTVARTLAY